MSIHTALQSLHRRLSAHLEIVHHAAFMALFYYLARLSGSPQHGALNDDLYRLTVTVAPDLTWLGIFFLGLLLAGHFGATKPGLTRFIQRVLIALLYLLIIAQLRFEQETGMFFSLTLAAYTLENFQDLRNVVFGTGLDHHFALHISFALCGFLLAAIARPTSLISHFSLVTAITLYLVIAFITASHFLSGKQTAHLSIAAALTTSGTLHAMESPALKPYPFTAPQKLMASSTRQPDILLIAIESARAKSTPGFSGDTPPAQMPTLEKLLPMSRVFERAYTTTSHTSKALVGMLCGVPPIPGMAIKESTENGIPFPCLPGLLSSAGYRTLFMQSATEHFENRRQLVANLGFKNAYFKEQIDQGHPPSGYFGLDENALEAPLMSWWKKPANEPRFAVVLTSMSHHPYQMPGRSAGTDADALDNYHDTLRYTDALIGKVLTRLKDSGALANTIVIITGDHGEGFGEHRVRQHDAVPYEEGIHVPLLIYDGRKNLPVGSDKELRQHIDLAPTILQLAGISHDGQYPGIDLMSEKGHQQVITNCWYGNWCMSLVQDQKKWIYFPEHGKVMTFSLDSDPAEQHDLSEVSSAEESKAAVSAMLENRAAVMQMYSRYQQAASNSK